MRDGVPVQKRDNPPVFLVIQQPVEKIRRFIAQLAPVACGFLIKHLGTLQGERLQAAAEHGVTRGAGDFRHVVKQGEQLPRVRHGQAGH